MQRPHSSAENGFDSTPPMSASSSMSNASTAHSVFYHTMPNVDAGGGQYLHHPNGGQSYHPQLRVSPNPNQGGAVFHEVPQGRIAYSGHPSAVSDRRYSMSGSPHHDDGPFMPMSSSTYATPLHNDMTSPSMGTNMSHGYPSYAIVSPTDEIRHHQHQQAHAQEILAIAQQQQQQRERGRPSLMPRHSMPGPPPQFAQLGSRPPIQRHVSLHTQAHQPPRSASPHLGAVGDVFDANPSDSPVRRSNSSLGLPLSQIQEHPTQYDSMMDMVSLISVCRFYQFSDTLLMICSTRKDSLNDSVKGLPPLELLDQLPCRLSTLLKRHKCARQATRGLSSSSPLQR